MSHNLSKSEKEKVIQIISSHFFQQYDEILAVYKFGSFISERHFSDIDVGIITAA
jgi:predicted nucleotidyltransferase